MKLKRLAIAAVTVGLLAASVTGASAQDDGRSKGIESFRTREMQPGVLRVLDDNAGHDLTRKWPRMRRDVDHIAVSPSGEVWISITASGPDNDRLKGARIWPLGRSITYGPKDGLPGDHRRLLFDETGQLWVIGSKASLFDGQQWTSIGARYDLVAPDGTVWLSTGLGVEAWDGTELTRHLDNTFTDSIFVSPDGIVGVNAWNGIYLYDGSEWSLVPQAGARRAVSPDGTLGALVPRRDGLRLYRDGEVATVLKGTRLDEIAVAPDGSFWLAGGVGKSNGGVYRVDPAVVFASLSPESATTDAGTSKDETASG